MRRRVSEQHVGGVRSLLACCVVACGLALKTAADHCKGCCRRCANLDAITARMALSRPRSCDAHRDLQHGIIGLERVGALLPHVAVALHGRDVAAYALAGLRHKEIGDTMLSS